MSGEQISQCGSGAAVRHVNQVYSGHHLKQFAGEVGYGAVAGRGHVDLAWIGFGVGDQFTECPGRERRVRQNDLGFQVMLATGAMSRRKLKLSFGYSVALIVSDELTKRSV